MSSKDTAVSVRGLSKAYTITHNATKHTMVGEMLMHRLRHPFERPEKETFWALNNVEFDIQKGDVVGIIGRNGAGKSTLLKILSRITKPTRGQIDLYGRVGSLLEVGTGFHPELTGRENIFLNGAILGMRKREIERQFDAIIDFAGVEQFLDTPVKRYSSGMYVRLAFAVAAHLNPEILIIDEVLAVGDANFQKKCLGKMQDVSQKEGKTVLFVSHNMTAVQSLCSRVLCLESGRVTREGPTRETVSKYLESSFTLQNEQVWEDLATAPGNEKFRLHRVAVRPLHGEEDGPITVRTPLVVEFEYWNLVPDMHLNLSVVVNNEEGQPIFNTGPNSEKKWNGQPFPTGLFRSVFYIPGDLLNDGAHRIQLYAIKDKSEAITRLDDVLVFDIQDAVEMREGSSWHSKWIGAVRPHLQWETDLIEPLEMSEGALHLTATSRR